MNLPTGVVRAGIPHALVRSASETVELTAGQRLKIETSPDGEEVLDVVVPAGKHWAVGLYVSVTERNV